MSDVVAQALERLALALTKSGHVWTEDELQMLQEAFIELRLRELNEP